MREKRIKRSVLLTAIIMLAVMSAGLGDDWPTFGHDTERTGWAFEEDKLSVKNAGNLELKWKIHLDNKALSMTALTAPLVASDVTTPEGVKTLVYVAGSSNHVFAVDAATGKLAWSHDFTAHVSPAYEGMWLCPNNLNATPVIERRAGLIYALNAEGRLFGLDLGDGKERFGPVQFVPPYSKVWSLNLFEGVIYTSISQNCADTPSGIYATDIRDPNRPVVRALLVDDHGAGVWGRGGPVISPGMFPISAPFHRHSHGIPRHRSRTAFAILATGWRSASAKRRRVRDMRKPAHESCPHQPQLEF